MIKTIWSADIYNVLNWISAITTLIDLYSSEPTPKPGCYGFISIITQDIRLPSNKWNQVKQSRVSITIVCPHQDEIATNEENYIDNIINTIVWQIADEWCSKIKQWWTIIPLYCIEDTITPMMYTVWNRAYKVKDFLIWYESHHD